MGCSTLLFQTFYRSNCSYLLTKKLIWTILITSCFQEKKCFPFYFVLLRKQRNRRLWKLTSHFAQMRIQQQYELQKTYIWIKTKKVLVVSSKQTNKQNFKKNIGKTETGFLIKNIGICIFRLPVLAGAATVKRWSE